MNCATSFVNFVIVDFVMTGSTTTAAAVAAAAAEYCRCLANEYFHFLTNGLCPLLGFSLPAQVHPLVRLHC